MVSSLVVGRTGKMKLVKYDASKLLKYGALMTMGVNGTVINRNLLRSCLQYVFVFSACAVALFVVTEGGGGWDGGQCHGNATGTATADDVVGTRLTSELIGSIENIHGKIRKPTMFIFGLFTSLTIGRWWALRVGALGVLMDAVVHVATYLACAIDRKPGLAPEVRAELEQDAFKVVKLGVASVHCITQLSRDSMDYQEFVGDELLTAEEAAVLEGCPDSCQVLWGWIATLGDNLMTRVALPPPNHNPFIASVGAATMAITRIQAYHDSQLPYPYVHMMVMLVNVNNLLISVLDGLEFSRVINGMCLAGFSDNQFFAALLHVLHLLLVPTFYQALLQICFLIEDPMGDDITDFPIKSFQLRTYKHCKALMAASSEFWDQRRAAQAAAPAPAAQAPPAPAPTPPAPAAVAPPQSVQQIVEEQVTKQFEVEMAKHVADVMSADKRLTRAADDLSKHVAAGPGAPIPAK